MLAAAVERARSLWAGRLVAAYALGSLAHGGFSELVSDVDFGAVLDGSLTAADTAAAARLSEEVSATGLPLSDRLSVFWGSRATLAGDGQLGRFPPIDRMDLVQHGRLLFGADVRAELTPPARHVLMLHGAESGLNLLGRASYKEALARPSSLLAGGPKPLTKTVLFPVRFVYTARTGRIGRNHEAVDHFVKTEHGPAADLAAAALRWRDVPPVAEDATAAALLEGGLRPIWERFLEVHIRLAAENGAPELADSLRAAGQELGLTTS